MRYLIIFALAYFVFKTVKNMLSQVKIVDKDSMYVNDQVSESSTRLKVDESDIEDADFKEVE
ncbi:MAG: hypothetical protein HN995_11315 [Candidatus Marinimicrobia bacterium]|jgi:hypothetical protein|nr:hypothetical protein [Candidatus Neomarinimicrobiota bacterium]MBT3574591.1 hypothetical protein [Candidatus Neomarinimicrobiota bacterium]MBT3679515.1 hypothetical protein [Candidatus Neomarinimicrobiota bacterium]MBT3950671.1 hypothetical protein [Candidatus Neomarinimicrobiota bacterium]MBT4252239.1 hypothetical protein [Candidatus Neomarinimicrobiota bacterium]